MEQLGVDLRQMRRTPLHDSHVEALRDVGTEVVFDVGEYVAEAGQAMDRFVYVLDGEVELVDPSTGKRTVESTLGPSQFAGEIAFLNGGTFTLALRACRQTRALVVPRPVMLDLMARIPEMSDIIITVFAGRRRRLITEGDSGLTLIGMDEDRTVRRIASFASRNRIPFKALDLDSPQALAKADQLRRPGQ